MRKIKPFAGRKDVRARLVLRDEIPITAGKPTLKKDGSLVLNEFGQMNELYSLEIINSIMNNVLTKKSKSDIRNSLDLISKKLTDYSKYLDDIGDGLSARKARKLVKTIPNMSLMLDKGSKTFFGFFKKFILDVNSLDPSLEKSPKSNFDSFEFYKNIKPRKIELTDSKGFIIDAPISMLLNRPISESDKTLLERQNVYFTKGINFVLIKKAVLFILNKKFFNGDYHTVASMAIQAISKNDKLIPLQDIYKETDRFFAICIIPEKFIRIYNNLFSASKKVTIHIK